MPAATPARSHRRDIDPEPFEPGSLPVDPDEGSVPVFIPQLPEHEPSLDPQA